MEKSEFPERPSRDLHQRVCLPQSLRKWTWEGKGLREEVKEAIGLLKAKGE